MTIVDKIVSPFDVFGETKELAKLVAERLRIPLDALVLDEYWDGVMQATPVGFRDVDVHTWSEAFLSAPEPPATIEWRYPDDDELGMGMGHGPDGDAAMDPWTGAFGHSHSADSKAAPWPKLAPLPKGAVLPALPAHAQPSVLLPSLPSHAPAPVPKKPLNYETGRACALAYLLSLLVKRTDADPGPHPALEDALVKLIRGVQTQAAKDLRAADQAGDMDAWDDRLVTASRRNILPDVMYFHRDGGRDALHDAYNDRNSGHSMRQLEAAWKMAFPAPAPVPGPAATSSSSSSSSSSSAFPGPVSSSSSSSIPIGPASDSESANSSSSTSIPIPAPEQSKK